MTNKKQKYLDEFHDCVNDLLEHPKVLELKLHEQHCKTSRYLHSYNVAFYSFVLAKKWKLDARSIARAGLLHDLYTYDWRIKDEERQGNHAFVHPKIALKNAQEITEVNDVMEDVIVHHMWPLASEMPKSKEAWTLQMVDKYCALQEIFTYGALKSKLPRISYAFGALISVFAN